MAENTNNEALINLAKDCMAKGDNARAASLLEQAANGGNYSAMLLLAKLYLKGTGVPQNTTVALNWIEKSAQGGNYHAKDYKGLLYLEGKYVQKDVFKAFECFRSAAEFGQTIGGMLHLSTCYEKGIGCLRDENERIKWLKRAVEKDSDEARYRLAKYYKGKSYSFDQQAEALLKQIISHNSAFVTEAKFLLATIYMGSTGGGRDNGLQLLNELANSGHVDSMLYLGRVYSGEYSSISDLHIALNWYQRAANMGNQEGKNGVISVKNKIAEKTAPPKPAQSQKSGGCYVATAVYGSYDCPQVWTLRRFRDTCLSAHWYGRAFIKVYYAISPTLVRLFGKKRFFNTLCKKPLDRLINKLKSKGIKDTPYIDS